MIKLWTTGLGLGLIPKAPGTFGSILGVLIYLFTKDFFPIFQTFFCFLYFFLSIIFIQKLIAIEKLDHHDQQTFVCDEVCGMWLVCFLASPSNELHYLLCFILFRVFDITKPFPVSWLDQKVKGGLGVMIDDICASLYATIAYFICIYLIDRFGGLFL